VALRKVRSKSMLSKKCPSCEFKISILDVGDSFRCPNCDAVLNSNSGDVIKFALIFVGLIVTPIVWGVSGGNVFQAIIVEIVLIIIIYFFSYTYFVELNKQR